MKWYNKQNNLFCLKSLPVVILFSLVFCSSIEVFAYKRITLLPDDTNFIFHLSNAKMFGDKLRKSPVGRLWNDKEFQEFCGNINLTEILKKTLIQGAKKNNQSEIEANLIWQQFTDIKGEFIIAFRKKDGSDEMETYFISQYTFAEYQKMLDIDKRITNMNADKSNFSEYTFHGVKIFHFVNEDKTKKKISHSWETWVNGTALQSENKEWVEKSVLKLLEQKPEKPTKNLPFLKFTICSPTIKQWTDVQDNKDKNLNSLPANKQPNSNITKEKILSAIGLKQIKSVSISVLPSQRTIVFRAEAYGIKQTKGVLYLLDTSPISLKRKLSYAPKTVVSYQETKLNLRKFWEKIPEILNSINPALTLQFQGLCLMLQTQVGIDIYNDFICLLDSHIINYSCLEPDNNIEKVTAIGITDTARINKTLAALFKADGPVARRLGENLKKDTVGGYTLYSVALGLPAPANNNPKISNINTQINKHTEYVFAAADGNLLIGDSELVRQIIQNSVDKNNPDAAAYYKSQNYEFTKKNLPAKVYSYSVLNYGPIIEALTKFFRNPTISNILTANLMPNSPFSGLKFDKMPNPAHLSKFIKTVLSYLQFKDGNLTYSLEIYDNSWKSE